MFEDVSNAAETGAIAQRRRMGDRHVRNALRTWASAVRAPEPPNPFDSLNTRRSLPNTALSWRGKETQALSVGSVRVSKKRLQHESSARSAT